MAKRRIREFEPVPVVVANKGGVEICRLDDAVILLIGKWPSAFATSAKRLTAISLCREALEGRIWPDIARKAFVSAAEEAGVLDPGQPAAEPQVPRRP
ncbi:MULTISPECIES: DUF982 domain-containing protein [unclassified Chelatococcus]|uniref:DUF982 domain-containing protein n=1 Tax=unclassified Chelatococcus TaxID=2638111 RepID=UPI001BD0E1F6|nr:MULTISPECIES: DUF982 domain-containing protein [unclassified Chelatococcus]MBS7697186.1 DUF982 domain-containing protein [Chelatococcus sp. YT9]MBX3556517.1 DUF982 domain-containing protein [Chelatococcus sp.]